MIERGKKGGLSSVFGEQGSAFNIKILIFFFQILFNKCTAIEFAEIFLGDGLVPIILSQLRRVSKEAHQFPR